MTASGRGALGDLFAGAGEMRASMRQHNWAATRLGEPAGWPQSLRNAVRLLHATHHPMVIFWGADSLCLFNDAYCLTLPQERRPNALGRPAREVWGEVWNELISPQIEQVMLGGAGLSYENKLLPISTVGYQDEIWRTYSYSLIEDPASLSGVGGVLGICNDVTQTRDRSWRLSQDLLAVAGTDGTITAVNEAWPRLLGWTRAELLGVRFTDLIHPDDKDATFEVFVTIFKTPLTSPYEFRFQHKDGSYRWFGWTAAFEDGHVYANGRHTTAEHLQNETLRRTEEQLRQSQKMEAVGQLTGGLAHDFNNLLTGVLGSLELAQSSIANGHPDCLERYILTAQAAAQRATALTHRLLAFSRQQTLDPKPTNINRLVAGMEELVRRTVGPAISLKVTAAPDLWATHVDAHQLENAFLNLCLNARDAMPDGGCLAIETSNASLDAQSSSDLELPPGDYVSLSVADTGVGMSHDIAAHAFEPFFTTKPIGQGTGLGLSMIYGFVRQSGGQVQIRSEPGAGALVRLYLPRHSGSITVEAVEEVAPPRGSGRGETILVVDDDNSVRTLVAEVLTELGYQTMEAENGLEGLNLLQSDRRIDLLVTDVGLPGGLNGRQVADAARRSRPGLKVLFITGYAANAVLDHGALDQGMHVLTKPFRMDALRGRVSSLLAG